MSTLNMFGARAASGRLEIPATTAWYLSDLGEALGKQALHAKQSPQRLKRLRESAIVESAIASNRIEGVAIDPARVNPVLAGHGRLRDRDEAEVRGYRDALRLIHEDASALLVTEQKIRELHRVARAKIGDAGTYRTGDLDIIERYADGRARVRFKAVSGEGTPKAMSNLVRVWNECVGQRWGPSLVAIAAFNLDFLCIHPFRDGNGRVSRLLLLLQLYHFGYEVGRYISLERLIEEQKDRYYETLELSSQGWHEARHDPWPYINYLLHILKTAYREFEARVGDIREPRGAKTEAILAAVGRAQTPFTVSAIQRACPGVGLDLVRHLLKKLQTDGMVECLGRGQKASWRRTARWQDGE
jgi:Fic family protein